MKKIRDQVIPAKNYYEKGWRVYSKELCIFTIRFVICKSQFYMFTFNDPCILSMPLYGMGEIIIITSNNKLLPEFIEQHRK